MNNFLGEIVSITKLPFDEILKDVKVTIIGGKIAHISNYIKILNYTTEKLTLKVYKNTLEIIGTSFSISQINKNEIILKGNIYSCNLGDGSGKK